MKFLPVEYIFRHQSIGVFIALFLFIHSTLVYAVEDIQFNIDMLDLNDRKNIDLSRFSQGGYIMPGSYRMTVHVNKNDLQEHEIMFFPPDDDAKGSRACVNRLLVDQLGFKSKEISKIRWWHNEECLDENSIQGMEVRGDLASSALYLSIPQAFLEYTDDNWDPPARWDDGISGILFDYNFNGRAQRQQKSSSDSYSLSGNGTAGANAGPWRFRADWQANLENQSGSNHSSRQQFEWSRYYLYRAISSLRAKLILGEDYLDSGLFDSFRFTGASLISDDSMLPPNLRGYAPEVAGVAKTNAKVIISQQGRVLYETTVATGPYRIRDINDAVSGELMVRVEEQDGSVQTFTINTANIPFLTRPGSVRFKLAVGQPSDFKHQTQGPIFNLGELSWGISNGWSLYGGALIGGNYNALSLGIGRDLMTFGALSFDVTESRAHFPKAEHSLSGSSYRLSYSKDFDEYDSQVTFAGYRFSQEEFMSMSQYLDKRYNGNSTGNGKEMYTITFNKHFRDIGLSAYLNYSHETFWEKMANNRYNLTLSSYFDLGRFRNLSWSLSAYRNKYNNVNDDGAYMSVTMPWGNGDSVSYSATVNRENSTHSMSYFGRIDESRTYQLRAGASRTGGNASGYYTKEADLARFSANASYQASSFSAMGMSVQGGMTLTAEGGALHRAGTTGGTRMLVDTEGVPKVPVRGYGRVSRTNRWGKAVIGDVNSYYRNKVNIDLNQLGENAEATTSVVQATLTEGAIGYRKFGVIAGEKAMAIVKLSDGTEPPFGATVHNIRGQETGIVTDGGSTYLSGINQGESMRVHWNGKPQCEVRMPTSLPKDMLMNTLLLPCQRLKIDTIP
ncbi:outer membrane usher protein [Enterobacter huaxiensis]